MILWALILNGPTGNDMKVPDFQGDWFELPQTSAASNVSGHSWKPQLGALRLSPETCSARRQPASKFGPNPNSLSNG